MSTAGAQAGPLSTREKIALGVSGAIVLAAVVYWIVQIGDVIETLKLAYG
jgi:hypothetical protein